MKRKKLLYFFLFFALPFYLSLCSPKEVAAANSCYSITAEPGNIGSNSLIIKSDQIVNGEEYKLNIDGRGKNYDLHPVANQNEILEVSHDFQYLGEYVIKLEHKNGHSVCKGTVEIKPGEECDWEITPEAPIKDQKLTVTIKNIRGVVPKGDFQIKVVKTNNNEDRFTKNKETITYKPEEAGNYYFRLYSLKRKNVAVCSINVFVGTTAEPGHIGTSQIGAPDLGIYDLCQGEESCSNCFNNEGAWTALGCIPTDPLELAKWALPYFFGLGGLAAFGLIVFSGLQLMTSSGDPHKVQAAKETITSALTGLIFIILSLFLLRLIGVDILGLPGLE
jgi:hypothetical protein